jgi:hypothetical protein
VTPAITRPAGEDRESISGLLAQGSSDPGPRALSAAIWIWLWHKDREVVTYSYGSPRDIMIAIL